MEDLLTVLRERGLVDSIAGEELFLRLKAPCSVYIGFDPTADSLHLGNFIGMIVLAWCQKLGHTPVVVLGGATGRIGDPSGKSKERPVLDDQVIRHNISCIRKNFEKILDFSGALPMPVLVDNNEWLSEFSFVDFLRDVGKHFRIGPMLAKESVRSRVHSEEGMSFTEFSYMLLQSYDFYHLFENRNVVLQMGGSDQWGNITAGIDLIRKISGKEAFGLTFPLITRSDGKKFGKSEEGAIWLSKEKLSPYQFYQYLYAIPDADVISFLKKMTFMDLKEIAKIEEDMKKEGYLPNTAQKRLAREVTLLVHGEEGLSAALRVTEGMGPGSSSNCDMPTVETIEEIARDMPNVELLLSQVVGEKFTEVARLSGLVLSKGEAARLIQNQGAYLNQQKVVDVSKVIDTSDVIGGKYLIVASGKKRKILVRVKR
jgi:tyrosyl-tRNA synthetase